MSNILTKIKEGILENFPEVGDVEITAEMKLGEIPEWDSVAAVNLQTFLKDNFGVEVPLDFLHDETTLGEIVEFIEKPKP
jgi:acyl carrier protein